MNQIWIPCHFALMTISIIVMNGEIWETKPTKPLIIVTSSAVLSCIIHVPLCSSKPRYGETTALQGVAAEVHMSVSLCPLVEDVEVSC